MLSSFSSWRWDVWICLKALLSFFNQLYYNWFVQQRDFEAELSVLQLVVGAFPCWIQALRTDCSDSSAVCLLFPFTSAAAVCLVLNLLSFSVWSYPTLTLVVGADLHWGSVTRVNRGSDPDRHDCKSTHADRFYVLLLLPYTTVWMCVEGFTSRAAGWWLMMDRRDVCCRPGDKVP